MNVALPRTKAESAYLEAVLPGDQGPEWLRRLRRAGYAVRYEEFAGGHAVPETLAREALQAFVQRPQVKQKIAA